MSEVSAPDGPERTLLYGKLPSQQEAIALLYINTQLREARIGWPLGTPAYAASGPGRKTTAGLDASRTSILLDIWLRKLLPVYGFDIGDPNCQLEIEFYVGGDYYRDLLQHPLRTDKIVAAVNGVKVTSTDKLGLLNLKTNTGLVLELCYNDNEYAVQCACLLKDARLRGFIPLFREFHANDDVRAESEIALRAFSGPSHMTTALNAFSPLPVTQ